MLVVRGIRSAVTQLRIVRLRPHAMEIVFVTGFVAVLSWLLVSLLCRRAVARGRHPGLWQVCCAVLTVLVLTVLIIGQGDLFSTQRWERGPVTIWYPICIGAAFTTIESAVVCSAVVFWRRRRASEA